MSKQYFQDVLAEPPISDFAAVVATVETALLPTSALTWSVTTPIGVGNLPGGVYPGKTFHLFMGGIWSTSASASTLTITPRIGASTSGTTLTASQAQTVPASLTNQPWTLEAWLTFRTISNVATSSTAICHGRFISDGVAATAGSSCIVTFGGTQATVDTTNTTATSGSLFIGWTLSVAGSCTPKQVVWTALN